MWGFFSRYKKNESGQGLAEFAIVMPVLLFLLMGIIQFGCIFNGQVTVTSAAREGARLAVVGATNEEIIKRVGDAAGALLLKVNSVDINRAVDGDDGVLSVKVNGSVDIVVPLLDMFTGPSFDVSSESVMRVEVKP